MKARTLDELERWVFVLSKMWKLSQLLPPSPSSSSCNSPLRKASVPPQGAFNHRTVIIPPATTTPSNTTQCKSVRKVFLTAEKISFIENWLSSVNEQVYQPDDCENKLQKNKSFTQKHLSCIEEMPNPNKLPFNFFQDANTVYTDESETHKRFNPFNTFQNAYSTFTTNSIYAFSSRALKICSKLRTPRQE
ncbi:hypothetical protein RMCBS344292_04207 [Rhizopus microsporus]|nr:hypothetical protein RMCBS344292_04207 [Rhizopus microsporus]